MIQLEDALGAQRIALLHHWDTDGASSAALVVRALRAAGWEGEASFVCAELGAYEIGPAIADAVAAHDPEAVFLLDYNVSVEHQDRLASTCGVPVYVIDHHKPRSPEAAIDREGITFLNPIAGGGGEMDYPATTWVLEKHLGAGPRWLVDMGIVGDLHHRAIPWFEALSDEDRRLDAAPYDYDTIFEAGQLVDALYKVNDRAAVEAAAAFLAEAETLDDVLGAEAWRTIKRDVDAEMERLLSLEPTSQGGALVFTADTHMNLSSAITRHLAREHDGTPVVVVNGAYYSQDDQYYVRNLRSDAVSTAIASACARGWSAGGKDSVFAAIVPKTESEAFLGEIIALVEGE